MLLPWIKYSLRVSEGSFLNPLYVNKFHDLLNISQMKYGLEKNIILQEKYSDQEIAE